VREYPYNKMEDKQDFFSQFSGVKEDASAKLNKEVLNHLFTQDRDKLLMITDFAPDDLIWVTGFQAELRFMVDDFITSKRLRNKCYKFMEDIYKMRISQKRLGRTELFDALKSQNIYNMAQDQGLMGKIKNRLQ